MRPTTFIGTILLAAGCVHRSAMPAADVRHISVAIDRPQQTVYAFASRPENVPRWARGLATSIAQVGGEWIGQSPMGRVKVRFAPPNTHGVLDHDVTLESGVSVHVPMRVIARDGGRSEAVFTLFRLPGVSDAQFEKDASAVRRDLVALRDIVAQGTRETESTPTFRAAVEAHLAAVAARDMDRLLPTLTRGSDLVMIAPNGFKWDTRQQYVDFHRQWFATADDGRLTTEIVHLIESPALGHALIKYRYTSRDASGRTPAQVIDSWLALTFAWEDGSWRLVFDQNTQITGSR